MRGSRGWGAVAALAILLIAGAGAATGLRAASPPPNLSPPIAATSDEPLVAGATSVVVAPAYSLSVGVREIGPADPGATMSVVVGIAPSDPAGLAAYAAAVSTPGTPLYQRYLSPAALAARYLPSTATVRSAEQYFRSFGLSATANRDGLLLDVAGPASSMGKAFSTEFAEYRTSAGREFVSHATPATLPPIAGWSGAYGLGNVTPISPALGGTPTTTPGIAPSTTCVGEENVFTPCQIATAYGASALFAAGTNGSGRTVAVVDAYSAAESQGQLASDLERFASSFGLPTGGVQFDYPVPTTADLNATGTNSGWTTEDALDLEWARASAPGATIRMTFSPNSGAGLYAAVDWLVANDATNVISMSWGEPDTGIYNAYAGPCAFACNASTDGSYAVLAPVLQLAAAEGISVFAASGDCGAADGTSGVATNFPASDPYVTGVGGTELVTTSNGTYEEETAWSGNATGAASPGCQNQGGSGGGYAPFARPWWQVGLPSGESWRGVPDVAADAGVPVVVYQGGSLEGVEGTSVATPIWAGFAAVADQVTGRALGFLDPRLYAISVGPDYDLDFHDTVTGSNGYLAGVGWDPVTGLGSPDLAALAADLAPTAVAPNGAGAFVYASPRFGPAPLDVRFSIGTPSNGSFPLEGVAFGDGNASFVANGTVAHTYAAPGVYAAQSYVMNANGNVSVSPPVVIVVGGGGPLAVTLSSNATAVATGSPVAFATAVAGGVGPYTYSYWFGDGSFRNTTESQVSYAYPASGGFCAAVTVRDGATPPNGGASARIAIAVGGDAAPNCGNDTAPVSVTPTPPPGPWDAPADLPSLFSVTGGTVGPGAVGVSITYTSSDPYVTACDCAIFRAAGTYSVEALVADAVNSIATAETNVTISAPLVGAFSASSLSGPAPLDVSFAASLEGGVGANPATTAWSFGNGNTAVGADVTAVYATPGEYLARGVVRDTAHGNASEAFLIDVAPPAGVAPLGVVGTVSPATNLLSGTTVAFSARAVGNGSAAAGPPTWQIGSGSLLVGSTVNRTYFGPAAPGDSLNASVSVGGSGGPAVAFSLPSFFATLAGGFVPRASALTLSDTVTPVAGIAPLTVVGTANASGPGGAPISWAWGDGTETNASPAVHVYVANGSFLAIVRASDPWGDVAVDAWGVAVGAALTVAGGPSVFAGVAPLTVDFSAVPAGGSGPPYTLAWSFGDGTTAAGSPTNHTYRSTGVFVATLTVTDVAGHVATRSWLISVLAVPTGSFPVRVAVAIGGIAVAVGVACALAFGRRPRRPTAEPVPTP